MRRTGFLVLLSEEEKQKLAQLAERLNRTKGDALRQLINSEVESNEEENGK